MGTPVPPETPELEDLKWYKCTVDCYEVSPVELIPTCEDLWVAEVTCCNQGFHIKNWVTECVGGPGNELCHLDNRSAQRLTCCMGPYDTHQECLDDI